MYDDITVLTAYTRQSHCVATWSPPPSVSAMDIEVQLVSGERRWARE